MRATRWLLGTSIIPIFAACSSGSPETGAGGAVLPPSAAAVPGPSGPQSMRVYFEGSVDMTAGTMTLATRSPTTGALLTESVLPYGTTPGNVFFHTCTGTLNWAPPLLTGTVQAVNLMSNTVTGVTAVIDSVQPSTVTFASPMANYGDVVVNAATNCGAPNLTWTFHNPNGTSFTFKGEADGRPPSGPPTVPASGLSLRWKLNEGSGATATDSSGNGHNGAYTHGTWPTSACLFPNCAQFSGTGGSGTGSYATIGTAVPISTSGVSFAVWTRFAPGGTGTYQTIFNGPNACCTYRMLADSNFHPFWDAGSHVDVNPTGFTFPVGQWFHTVFTIAGGASRNAILYVNGVAVASSAAGIPVSLPAMSNFAVATADGFQWPGKGNYNDMLVYNRVLSAGEVTSLYNSY